ncbi:hypothetical protein COO60DRAFT_662200 [Scenedesmus sp. NREL 46B-D3]|nr:hypothetical protein COO60DRAFT_662200 [Scenedesmus sp. NREL 46B-D3]
MLGDTNMSRGAGLGTATPSRACWLGNQPCSATLTPGLIWIHAAVWCASWAADFAVAVLWLRFDARHRKQGKGLGWAALRPLYFTGTVWWCPQRLGDVLCNSQLLQMACRSACLGSGWHACISTASPWCGMRVGMAQPGLLVLQNAPVCQLPVSADKTICRLSSCFASCCLQQ